MIEQMELMRVDSLKPHPRNEDFFDDISGVAWDKFLSSIKELGVIEPLVITRDNMIVSGHQRVRACKELGIDTVACKVKEYEDDDSILRDLLDINIRQRGVIGGSDEKISARIRELERLNGVRHGGDRSKTEISVLKSQSELAAEYGMDADTWRNYRKLGEMIPELSDLVETGVVTKHTALAIMKQLSEDEQRQLIEGLDTTHRITRKEADTEVAKLKADLAKKDADLIIAQNEIKALKDRPVKEVVKEVIPDDYEDLKHDLESAQREAQRNADERKEYLDRMKAAESRVKELENRESDISRSERLKADASIFSTRVYDFIQSIGGMAWLFNEYQDIDEQKIKDTFIKSVNDLNGFAQQMMANIGGGK